MKRAEVLGAIVNAQALRRRLRHARQDHDLRDDRRRPRRGRTRSDRPRRRHGPQLRHEREARRRRPLVVEADEYDRTFHQLHPEIAVVTNIEADHLEYYGSFDAIVEAFRIFVDGVKAGGVIVGMRRRRSRRRRSSVARRRAASCGTDSPRTPTSARREPPVPRARLVVRSPRARLLQALRPGRAQRPQRAGGDRRRRASSASRASAIAAGAGEVPRRRPPLPDPRRLRRRASSSTTTRIIRPRSAPRSTRRAAAIRTAASWRSSSRISTRARATSRASSARRCASPTCAIVAPIYAAREKPIDGVSARIIADAVQGIEFLDRSNARDRATRCAAASSRTTSSSPWAPATSTRSPRSSCGGGSEGGCIHELRYDCIAVPPADRPRAPAPQPAAHPGAAPARDPAQRRGDRDRRAGGACWAWRHTHSDARFAVQHDRDRRARCTRRARRSTRATQRYVGLNLFQIDIARVQRDLAGLRWVQPHRHREERCRTRCGSRSPSACRSRSCA